MTSPLLTVSDTTPVNFELRDGIGPDLPYSGVLTLDAESVSNYVILDVTTTAGGDGAGLYLTRQGALDLAHALINLVHPHAG